MSSMPLSYVAASASSSLEESLVQSWSLAKSADDSNGVALVLIVCAAPSARHARAGGQAARDRGALVDLVDDPRVVLRECDAVSHRFSSLSLVQPGDLAPALHRRALVHCRARVRQARGARLDGRRGAPAEQLRLRRLQLLDVVDVVGKEDTRRFDVADARELWGCWKVCKNLDGAYTSFRDVTAGA